MNTSTLTISPVTEQDEDEYYCVASNGGADGSLYNDKSHNAMVTVYGELVLHNALTTISLSTIVLNSRD